MRRRRVSPAFPARSPRANSQILTHLAPFPGAAHRATNPHLTTLSHPDRVPTTER